MRIRPIFEPRDLWVGIYWNVDRHEPGTFEEFCYGKWTLSVYFCVFPTLVLLIEKDQKPRKPGDH